MKNIGYMVDIELAYQVPVKIKLYLNRRPFYIIYNHQLKTQLEKQIKNSTNKSPTVFAKNI